MASHPIFRKETLQKYMQNREKSVLPRFVAPSVFTFCWLALAFLIAAGIAVWLGRVPVYLTGSGVVLDPATHPMNEATAVILFPAASHLRNGLPVHIQIGQAGPMLNSTIQGVNQQLFSPSMIHQDYGLSVADPSFVVKIRLGPTVQGYVYAGSFVQVQVQTGSQSLLSLFPILNHVL